jgi:long-chain acyl-CoA synthetase
MTDRIWLGSYPPGVSADIDVAQYASLVELMDESFVRFRERVAYTFMGRRFTYGQIDEYSRALGAYFQRLGLAKGERVAIMMPNVPQYPVAVAAILRTGLVLVNVNPLYTPRELEHQLRDSGAKGIVILENFALTLQKCITATEVRHVVLCRVGDSLGALKGTVVNFVLRRVRKMVPEFQLANAVGFKLALAIGRKSSWKKVSVQSEDIAVLQYTGGTTGVAKGAVLLHRNLVANVLQNEAWTLPLLSQIPATEQMTEVCALPLYHIYAFTFCMMLSMRMGGNLILIINPRDIAALLKDMARQKIHVFPAVNTLFNAVVHHADFASVDWKHLRAATGGGAAIQRAVAKAWMEKTGLPILEGYGLSETSPTAAGNPADATQYSGAIGVPICNTWMKLLDDSGNEVAAGQPGEIAIKGPQVMAGYWQRPDETARVMTPDGYLKTGDIATMDERGYFFIIDRKKDMILVNGFNVYPAELEDVVTQMEGVLECACVGVPDDKSGEAVKLVVVRQDPALTEAQVRAYCKQHLTGYKQPRKVEFRTELPKTPVGKILRRELRDK